MTATMLFEITVLAKTDGGALTKQISLAADGTVKSDGSACTMARGTRDGRGSATPTSWPS
jgi:hypothetical protein